MYISSLSKGLGSFGGYVASKKNVIDLCINKSRSFIYTSALPNIMIEHAIKRFDFRREKYRERLLLNVKLLSQGLKQIGFNIESKTHIIPIIIGDEKKTLEFGKFMAKNRVFVQPIRYPTVKRGVARIRISVTAWLSDKHIDYALTIFDQAAKKFHLV